MPNENRVFGVLALGFVLLAMPLTAIGVAWPSIAADLQRAVGELGVVTVCFGAGYTTSTLAAGRMARRFPMGRLLLAAAIISGAGLTLVALSDRWGVFLLAVTVVGVSGGVIDPSTNTYVAIRRGPRAMGLIHATFGVGTIFGPLLITVLLAAGASWRVAFAFLAAAQLASVTGLWLFVRSVDVREPDDQRVEQAVPVRSATFFWSLAVFMLYAGVAAGAGAWSFTFLTEGRGISEGAAGLVVSGYWAAFTASRLILSAAGERMSPDAILALSGAATAAGLAVFWWAPTEAVGLAALVCTGFAHGPVFPLEVLLTRRRFGAAQTAAVVGYELAATNVGGAIIPGLIGILVGAAGLAAVPVFLFFNSLLLWGAIRALHVASAQATGSFGLAGST